MKNCLGRLVFGFVCFFLGVLWFAWFDAWGALACLGVLGFAFVYIVLDLGMLVFALFGARGALVCFGSCVCLV